MSKFHISLAVRSFAQTQAFYCGFLEGQKISLNQEIELSSDGERPNKEKKGFWRLWEGAFTKDMCLFK